MTHKISPTLLEDGSRYYECAECKERTHVAPSAPDDFIPAHGPDADHEANFREIKQALFVQVEEKAIKDAAPEPVEYEPAPEPEPEPIVEPDPVVVDEPAPSPDVPQPADVDEVERLPTYADETAVGEAVIDSNADVVPDVSLFVFQPPVEEPTDTSTPEDVVVEDEPTQADEGPK